jgi:hypothetical protein
MPVVFKEHRVERHPTTVKSPALWVCPSKISTDFHEPSVFDALISSIALVSFESALESCPTSRKKMFFFLKRRFFTVALKYRKELAHKVAILKGVF